jgi:hypothetical protein
MKIKKRKKMTWKIFYRASAISAKASFADFAEPQAVERKRGEQNAAALTGFSN